MIKVFTLNKNNKIELTKEELEKLLNQSFWEGYYRNNHTYTYTSPSLTSPWTSTITTATNKTLTTATTDNSITIKCNNE